MRLDKLGSFETVKKEEEKKNSEAERLSGVGGIGSIPALCLCIHLHSGDKLLLSPSDANEQGDRHAATALPAIQSEQPLAPAPCI